MKIIVARHGQTDWNVIGKLAGHSDGPVLTGKGIEHAEGLGRILQAESVSVVYCSSLGRAVSTAERAAKEYGIPFIKDGRLRELNFGIFEGTTEEERKKSFPWSMREWDKFNYRVPGGESYRDGMARTKEFVDEMISGTIDDVALIGHGLINRTVIANLLGLAPEEFLSINQHNSVVYFIDTCSRQCRWKDSIDGSAGEGLTYKKRR